jgi:hypothetical protein
VTYLGAGLITWWYRPANRIGPLMLAFAFAWFIGNLGGSGVPFLVSVGNGFESANSIFIVWLILAYPTGRLATRLERTAVVMTALVTVARGVIVVLTLDPCRFGCQHCREAGPALFPSFRVFHAASEVGDRAAFVLAAACSWRSCVVGAACRRSSGVTCCRCGSSRSSSPSSTPSRGLPRPRPRTIRSPTS